MSGEGEAIRHPKRGKAHRRAVTPIGQPPMRATACGAPTRHLTERVPLAQTAPEDRCRICWPACR